MKVKKVGENKYTGDSNNPEMVTSKLYSQNHSAANPFGGNKKFFISIGVLLMLIIIVSLIYFLILQKNQY
jgi:hypothetical protein